MFLWWSNTENWQASEEQPQQQPATPSRPPGSATLSTVSSRRRAQVVPVSRGGVVFGGGVRDAGEPATQDTANAAKGFSWLTGGASPDAASTTSDVAAPAGAWASSFFSWLAPNALEESNAKLAQEEQEIDALIQLLDSARGELPKGSDVSRAALTKWQVVEKNREIGESVRKDLQARMQQRRELAVTHAAKGREQVEYEKALRTLALEKIQEHREGKRAKGVETKIEKARWRQLEHEHKLAYLDAADASHDARAAAGRAQQARMLESRARLLAQRRDEVRELKQQSAERALKEYENTHRELDKSRQRVDRVRRETAAEVAASSASTFYAKRLAAADVVRKSIQSWRQDRAAKQAQFLSEVKANHDSAASEENQSWGGRLAEQRQRNAEAVRASIAHVEVRDRHQQLALQAKKRANRDTVYASKYADGSESGHVETSGYTAVANAHRGDSSFRSKRSIVPRILRSREPTPRLAPAAASPADSPVATPIASTVGGDDKGKETKSGATVVSRGNWTPYFKTTGFRAGFFSARV